MFRERIRKVRTRIHQDVSGQLGVPAELAVEHLDRHVTLDAALEGPVNPSHRPDAEQE
jgi:hypothetical protein